MRSSANFGFEILDQYDEGSAMMYCKTYSVLFSILVASLLSGCGIKTGENTAPGLMHQSDDSASSDPIAGNGEAGTVVKKADRSLRLMQFSLILLNHRYVDPDRINWRNMTVHGIDAIQNMVPEVVAQFDRRIDDNPSSLILHVGIESRHFNLANINSLADAYQTSEEAYNFIYSHLTDPTDPAELEYAMINGMFSTLDPHTNLLPPYLFEDVMTGNGGFGGCGFVVGIRDDNLVIISPMEGTPAWKAGIKAGDIVVRIDDESTENMPLQDAVDRMRGEPKTKVTLYVLRKGWTEPRPIVITREIIEIRSVTSSALKKDNVGYIKLKSFDKSTAEEVQTHLAALHSAMPKMKGLIIDLRNNSGGLLDQSILVAELFLNKGDTIVSVEGASKSDRDSMKARFDGKERDYPIVVLINEGSASASEIVSGALQAHHRAVIVGERSFGKGSVQILKDNPDGSAVKITSAQYLTPGDISIQGTGIVPDIRLVPSYVGEKDGVSLVETHNIRRESSLEQSLHSDRTKERTSAAMLRYLYEPSKEDENRAKELGISTYDLRSTEDYTEDDETRFAIEFIRQAKSSKADEIVKKSETFFAQYGRSYLAALGKAMGNLKIDWSAANPKDPVCEKFSWGVKFKDQNASEGETLVFPADNESNELVMWVKNECETGDLTQFSAVLTSNNGAFDERAFVFGRVAPGAQREWPVKIKLPKSFPTRDDLVDIQFYQGDEAHLQNKPLATKGQFNASVLHGAKPDFVYTYWMDDIKRGNGDGRLSRGESVDMYLWIKNVGGTDSKKIRVNIANESGSGVLLQQGKATVDNLHVGESRLVVLKFDVSQDKPQKPPSKRIKRNHLFNPDEVFLNLSIADEEFDTHIVQPVIIPVQTAADGAPKADAVTKSLAVGAELFSHRTGGYRLAGVKTPQNVRVYPMANGLSGVCWNEDELLPCAFVSSEQLSEVLSNEPMPVDPPEKSKDLPVPKGDENAGDAANDDKDKVPEKVYPASKMDAVFSYQAPVIRFEERSHTEQSASATIMVDLSDNEALRDYEAYVWTHDGLELKVEKLDYGLMTGKEKRIAIDVPLKQGDNSLVIVARDRIDTETVGTFHINRK